MKTFLSRSTVSESGHTVNGRDSKGMMAARIQDNRLESAVQKKRIDTLQKNRGFPFQMKFIESEPVQEKSSVQRSLEDEEEMMQGKFVAQRQPEEEEELLQGKFDPSREPAQKKENQTGIPDPVRTGMEASFHTDFSGVRVHPNSSKAKDVGALAYTQGSDIHFAPGQFSPDSSAGKTLLGHELAHVVQQRQGRVQATTQVNGIPVNDNPALEKEADILGSRS